MIWLTAVITLLFSVLAARLFWLQSRPAIGTEGGAALVRQSVAQRKSDVLLDEGRGLIVDARGRPLAGFRTNALLLRPAEATEGDVRAAARLLGEREEHLRGVLAGLSAPVLWVRPGEREPAALAPDQASALEALDIPWLEVVPYRRRYADPPAAAHLIGFVLRRDRIGAAGLERTFEPFLKSRGSTKLSFYRTAGGEPLGGLDERLAGDGNPHYPLVLAATLDLDIQRLAERSLTESGIGDGALVVLDVPSGDVLAMVSAPAFDPGNVEPKEGRWRNRALIAEAPGSVFKTVIAAAALDAGATRPGETFLCTGRHERGRIRCHARHGHGRVTLEEAYAQSCNVVFAELAFRLGRRQLEQAAARFGIGRAAGWRTDELRTPLAALRNFAQLDGEEAGHLFAPGDSPDDPAVLAQTAIGQHSVRMTPLQAAQWTAAVAKGGGRLPAPRAVSRVMWNNGRTMVAFPEQAVPGTFLSGRSARWLKSAMAATASRGTASRLAGIPGGAGGKTGTAQTGRDGLVHQWFTGYYPQTNPQYAVAVLARNRPENSANAAVEAAERLFRSLSGRLEESGNRVL
jgi:cell division protein FtsI/penicillin-binding protein 2